MPPSLALFLWLVLVLAFLYYDPARDTKMSLALWVPLIWMFIVGSRLPSQWLGAQMETAAQALEEGNAVDRTILTILILLALGILTARSFNWAGFFRRNLFLMAFLLFALASVFWSDFPFVALKRWFRDFGEYLVILVVLSDAHPFEATRIVLRRLCFMIIPLSILLIKYFPQIGIQYQFWSGAPMYVGATTSKNMLGGACLVSGIFFFWDTVARWPDRRVRRNKRIIALNIVFIGMTLWLLYLARSATSGVCLALGCLVIAAAHSRVIRRRPALLRTLIPIGFLSYLVMAFGFGMTGDLAEVVGRNATLTGRTDLWKILLGMHTNPIIGTGYESFWLGPRLQWIWQRFTFVNEAHNGYLEVYLNLGVVGLFLLGAFLIATYQAIGKRLKVSAQFGSLTLALWTILLFYNVSEAAFTATHLIWLTFLLGAIVIPRRAADQVRSKTAVQHEHTEARLSAIPVPVGMLRR